MLGRIDSFVLSRGRIGIHDAEELTALDLVGKTAKKTNEIVDHVNDLMKKGLEQPLKERLTELALSGELGELIQELVVIDGGVF